MTVDRYHIHDILTVATAEDLKIPDYFGHPLQTTSLAGLVAAPGPIEFDHDAGKRSGVRRYTAEDGRLAIDYKLPAGTARLAIESYGDAEFPSGAVGVRYTPAMADHGDIQQLAETVYRLKMLEAGWPLVHAGAVTDGDSATLITAPPDTGKTSTVLSLVGDGAGFMADDHVLLSSGGLVKSYPRPVNLSPFTLTGGVVEPTDDLAARAKRWLARSRFELLAGALGVEMGQRVTVPDRYVIDASRLNRVVVLGAGDPESVEIEPAVAARQLVLATLDEFDLFGHYALRLYAHEFDVDLLEWLYRLEFTIEEALRGVPCYRVRARDVADYPNLLDVRVEGFA